ncbi:hypothetical protein M5362_04245 [Streptomyces sp. Je 1-79]|uniref:hypothetical protein n=1 Tax=Streptomyces sp. Je 1-79 TaxID=2943847 RepID=UPI0021A6E080|nr:hypothetical protein [Streptomyces sp. Je 1-79]MCT4352342.1 hypothetical protein [Streptomyces sp. Je 1-79]
MERLGPLELVGDRWTIGDPNREGGSCLVLTAEGLEHHRNAEPEPQAVLPWSRFMQMQLYATTRAWMATRTMGALSAVGPATAPAYGRDGCRVYGLLRHPYEDWSARYSHHERPYTPADVFWLGHLLRHTVAAKAADRLGDAEWLATAVTRLATLRPSWGLTANRRAAEVIADLHNVGV